MWIPDFLPNDQYPKIPGILKGLKPYADLVAPLLSGAKIKKSPKVFNDKKITDHHAIIPTGVFSYDMAHSRMKNGCMIWLLAVLSPLFIQIVKLPIP